MDVVYYGTTATSKDDPTAVWNVYLAQTSNNGATFTQSVASNASNHTGVICTNGTGCVPGTRNLLDRFKVAINPVDGRAGVICTDDTLTKDSSSGNPLPQIVLAQQQEEGNLETARHFGPSFLASVRHILARSRVWNVHTHRLCSGDGQWVSWRYFRRQTFLRFSPYSHGLNQPRSGERMQPTAQGVARWRENSQASKGRKKSYPIFSTIFP